MAMRTRGGVLSSAIEFALLRAVRLVRGFRNGLTDNKRNSRLDSLHLGHVWSHSAFVRLFRNQNCREVRSRRSSAELRG